MFSRLGFCIFGLFFFFAAGTAQEEVDSLLAKGRSILYSNPVETYRLSRKAIELSRQQRNKLKEAEAYRLLSNYYSDIKGESDSAFSTLRTAETIYGKIESREAQEGIGAVYHNYGTIYHRQGDYVEAMRHYTKALSVFDRIGDQTIRLKTLNNLSSLYAFLKDYPKAEKYAVECLTIAKLNNDEHLSSVASITLADALISQKKYDRAKEYIDFSKQIATKRNDLYILELVHLNYGNYYTEQQNYALAISEFKKAYEHAVTLQNEWEQMRVSTNLSTALISNRQFDESLEITDKAFRLSEKLDSPDIKQRLLMNYSAIAANKGSYQKAYDYMVRSYFLKDTVLHEDNKRHIGLLESTYQTEKKEIRISALEREKKLYGVIFASAILALMLIILLLLLRHKAIKTKKELAEQKILQFEKEKQLIATQAVLDGENAERSRLARDLHDGLGGMLSSVKLNLHDMKHGAIVETGDITRFNKVLDMLDSAMQELRRVAHNMMPESLARYGLKVSLEDFCNSFPNVHLHFFGRDERFDRKTETTLYRIVHELVNNAVKHSAAESINVQFIQDAERLSITVQDNGKGFDPQQTGQGNGLPNIENRVQSIGGRMNLFTAPGKGTETTIDLDLTSQNNEEN